jgi:antitoxin component of MazEF toxin-antitoxin module
MTDIQKLARRGNSYYLKVSPAMMKLLGIDQDDNLSVTVENGRMTVQPVDAIPRISAEDKEFVDRTYAEYKEAFKAWAK